MPPSLATTPAVTTAPTGRQRVGWTPLLLGLVAFALYALSRSHNLALSHDSMTYIGDIEAGGGGLFHPHHLFYNAAVAAVAGVVGGAVGTVGALLNALAGAVGVGLVYAILRGPGGAERRLALAGAAGAAVSAGFWYYSGCVEVYAIPLALLLGTLYVALSGSMTARRALAVGALHGVAMLFHQIHVLFGVVVLAVLWRQRREVSFLGRAALYVLGGSILVLAGYGAVLAFVVRPENPEAAWLWFTHYAQGDTFWHPLALTTIAKAGVGFARSVIGGHFAFALEPVQRAMTAAFPQNALVDEIYLVRGLTTTAALGLLAAAAVAGFALVGLLAAGLRGVRQRPEGVRRVLAPLAAWVAVYSAFFLFWEPHNVEFWIPQATALWMIVALLWVGRSARAATVLTAAVAIIFGVNLVGTIVPAASETNDLHAQRFGGLATVVGEGDVVVVGRPHIGVGYTLHKTAATPVSIVAPFEEEMPPPAEVVADDLVAQIDAALASGHYVAFMPEAVELDGPTEALFGADAETVASRLRTTYGDRWVQVQRVPEVAYWVLQP